MSTENSSWIVLKFGGTSVSSRSNWENILSVVKERRAEGYKVCLVHSALSGISNELEAIIDNASEGNFDDQLATIKQKHIALGDKLEVRPGVEHR